MNVHVVAAFGLCVLAYGLVGCQSSRQDDSMSFASSHTSEVRDFVLKRADLSLTAAQRERIMRTKPILRQYVLAASFAQCGWEWRLPSSRTLTVSYTGDMDRPIVFDCIACDVR